MPWTPLQHRLFEGVAHGSIKPKDGLSKEKAAQMASEGIKDGPMKKKSKLKTLYKSKTGE